MPRPIGPFSFPPHAFLSEAQKELTLTSDPSAHVNEVRATLKLKPTANHHDIKKANQEALQQAIRASLHHDDGLTAAQKFARETGNVELIEEANKAAIEMAIAASGSPPPRASQSVRSSVPNEEMSAQRGLIAKLKNWLVEHGFIVKANHGNQNNCLLISMLQHVTGDYDPKSKGVLKEAERYKRLISDWSNGQEKTSSALFSDETLTELIVRQINEDYFGERRDLHIQFRIITADAEGEPAERYVGTGQRIEGIVDGIGHYEAFVKRPDHK